MASIIISNEHPVSSQLRLEGIETIDTTTNVATFGQDKPTLRIGVINLMPNPDDPVRDFARLFAKHAEYNIEIVDISRKPLGHQVDIDDIEELELDGIISSGFGREEFAFENLPFWSRYTKALDHAAKESIPVLGSCWAAQAILFHHYGVEREYRDDKLSGVFEQKTEIVNHPLSKDLPANFDMPVSRRGRSDDDAIRTAGLTVLASSEETGISIATDGRITCVTGHPEYPTRETIAAEYHRDIDKGVPNTQVPINTFVNDAPDKGIISKNWEDSAGILARNWIRSVAESKAHSKADAPRAATQSTAIAAQIA